MGATKVSGEIGNYVTKPQVILAVQWTGDNKIKVEELFEGIREGYVSTFSLRKLGTVLRVTLEYKGRLGRRQVINIPLEHWVVFRLDDKHFSVYSSKEFEDLFAPMSKLGVGGS